MQQNASDADSRYQAVMGSVTSDAGLMMDRARWLRANNYDAAALQLAARDHNFTIKPATLITDPLSLIGETDELAG